MQRITEGNPGLTPELGENESLGVVLQPMIILQLRWISGQLRQKIL